MEERAHNGSKITSKAWMIIDTIVGHAGSYSLASLIAIVSMIVEHQRSCSVELPRFNTHDWNI